MLLCNAVCLFDLYKFQFCYLSSSSYKLICSFVFNAAEDEYCLTILMTVFLKQCSFGLEEEFSVN
jgi:hypothetical protein